MPYILTGTDDNIQAYPHERIEGVTLSVIKPLTPQSTDDETDDTDDSDDSGTYTAIVQLSLKGAGTIKPYNETGDKSVVEPAKTIYREIMDGMINGKPVNLSDFELIAPAKKVPAKKTTPAKKTAPEAPAEQPSES